MLAINDKELTMLKKAAHEFSRKMLFPDREENDKFPFGPFFQPVLDKSFDVDFFHTILPESMGGTGLGMSALCVLLTSICTEDSSLGGIIFTHAAAVELMRTADSLAELEGICREKNLRDFLVALPVFSDPSEKEGLPRAEKNGASYRISGDLDYLVLGGLSGHALIPAVVSGQTAYSWFLVRLDPSVVDISEPILSLGLRACPAVDTVFNKAPATLIGKEGQGGEIFTNMSDRMHTAAAAMSLGIMKGSFKEAVDYAKKRDQGGRKIIQWSELQMILGNMAVQIRVSDMIVSQSSAAIDDNEPGWKTGSRAAALHVQSLACDVTTDGVQAMGGVGYMKDFGQEKRFRDAKHIQALLGTCPIKKLNYFKSMI